MTQPAEKDRGGVTVPRDALIHEEVAYDVAACERSGRDWSGSGDFYLTRATSPLAEFINCPDCLATRAVPPAAPSPDREGSAQ